MNKYYGIVCFLLGSIFSAVSQDFKAGLTGGVTFAQVDGDTYAGYNKPGIVFGGWVSRDLGEHIAAQMEIEFKQKGAKKPSNVKKNDYEEYTIDLNYVEVPILLLFKYKRFALEGGVSFGSLLNSSESDENGPFPEEDLVDFRNFETSTLVGFYFYITKRLQFNTRFSYSLNRIRIPYGGKIEYYDPQKHWFSRKVGQYNNVVSMSLYYTLSKVL